MINKTTVEIKNPVLFMDEIISDLKQEEISGEKMACILFDVLGLIFTLVRFNPYEGINITEYENIFGNHCPLQNSFLINYAHQGDSSKEIFTFRGRDNLIRIDELIEKWKFITPIREYEKVPGIEEILSLFRREMYFYHKFLIQLMET